MSYEKHLINMFFFIAEDDAAVLKSQWFKLRLGILNIDLTKLLQKAEEMKLNISNNALKSN